MSRRATSLVTGRRLTAATLLVAGLLALPVVMRTPDSPALSPAPPQTAAAAVPATGADAERQYSVLEMEDRRLLTLVASVRPGSGPYVQRLNGADTLVLTAGGLAYDLDDLLDLDAAKVMENGDVLLTTSVFVAPGARLVIDAPGKTLRLRSEDSGFVSLVAWKADLVLSGTDSGPLRVISWDTVEEGPDTDVVDGRAYVREVSGDMRLRYADVSHLGFWAGRTSGVSWTGSASTVATGGILGSSLRANHYGAFASQGEGLSVVDSVFIGNAVDGLSLHRSTESTTIRSSKALSNGRHGFSADNGSESVELSDVTASRNGAYGVFFSGTSLSEGQSAGGASLRTYGEVDISGGEFRENGKAGLRVVEGNRVAVTGTRVSGNRDGIVLAGTAAPTTVEDAVVTGNRRMGISVTDGSAIVAGNRVSGAATGIRIRDAQVTTSANVVSKATDHAISVVGAAARTSVTDNTISGRGPSGLDTFRLDQDLALRVSGNDVEGWTQDRDNLEYWSTFIPSHPMLVLWVVVLGAPVALALRRRRVPAGTLPYQDPLRRERPEPLRVHVGRTMAAGRPA
jgi:hypothetical protein